MIRFNDSRDVQVTGVTLRDSPGLGKSLPLSSSVLDGYSYTYNSVNDPLSRANVLLARLQLRCR